MNLWTPMPADDMKLLRLTKPGEGRQNWPLPFGSGVRKMETRHFQKVGVRFLVLKKRALGHVGKVEFFSRVVGFEVSHPLSIGCLSHGHDITSENDK